jgi:YVTN family beta-propeller protein
MRYFRKKYGWFFGGFLIYVLVALLLVAIPGAMMAVKAQSGSVFNRPTYSSPIAMSADNSLVWSVNPEDDSVSVIRTDTNELVQTIKVNGREPRSVALDATNRYAFVANAVGNSVSVIRIVNPNPANFSAVFEKAYLTGSEAWSVVISPDNRRLFVANSAQDTISVIDTRSRSILGNVDLRQSVCNIGGAERHFQPYALAVTQDSNRLYVTRLLSFTKAGGVQGDDNGKEGLVCRLNINTSSNRISDYAPASAIRLAAQDTGFPIDADGDGQADPSSAFPNQLQSIVIRDGHAYLPNIAASPSRPLKFNADTHAFVNRIDGLTTNEVDGGALNMHLGARNPEPNKKRLFFANPSAIAFTNQSGEGSAYAVSAGSDLLVKLKVLASGQLDFTVDADTTRYIDLNDPKVPETSGANAGKNPLGIVINDAGTVAYTMNFVSHNVSVVDLANDRVVKTIQTTPLPKPGSKDEQLLVGAENFFSSRGNFVRPAGTTVSTEERLSSEGWQNCASCHFNGWTDGVIWQFNTGPRKSVPLNSTFDPKRKSDQRILNYSALFDEVQEFDNNIRAVSGPGNLATPETCSAPPSAVAADPTKSLFDPNHGLLFGDNGDINLAPCNIPAFRNIANANRQQHRVQLPGSSFQIKALDAINEWVKFKVRTPNRPLLTQELSVGGSTTTGGLRLADVRAGEQLFNAANCQACHTGGKWTISTKDFVSPPDAAEISTEIDPTPPPAAGAANPAPNPNGAQYLFRFLRDVKSYNLNVPGAGNTISGQLEIGAVEKDTNNNDALGFDFDGDGKGSGFNVPSLLGIHTLPPYLHNGACETLDCVVADENHRKAGLQAGQSDPLSSASARKAVVRYLEAIDVLTPPPQ